MSEERGPNGGPDGLIFDKPCPTDIWRIALEAEKEGYELNPDMQKALDIRRLCLTVVGAIFELTEDPMLRMDVFMEADTPRVLHQGMLQLRELGIMPNAHAEEEDLDSPQKLTEYVVGQLLAVDESKPVNIRRGVTQSQVEFAGLAYWYLADASRDERGEKVPECPLDEKVLRDSSLRLWSSLAEVAESDSDLMEAMISNYMRIAASGGKVDLEELGIWKRYPKPNKEDGYFMLGISTRGIEVEEIGSYGQFLGSAFVRPPGKEEDDNGCIGYCKDDAPGGARQNTDLVLKEAEIKIADFLSNLVLTREDL